MLKAHLTGRGHGIGTNRNVLLFREQEGRDTLSGSANDERVRNQGTRAGATHGIAVAGVSGSAAEVVLVLPSRRTTTSKKQQVVTYIPLDCVVQVFVFI